MKDARVMVWLLSKEMGTMIRVQILDRAKCISHRSNTLEKCLNPDIIPQAISILDRLNILSLVWQPFSENEN